MNLFSLTLLPLRHRFLPLLSSFLHLRQFGNIDVCFVASLLFVASRRLSWARLLGPRSLISPAIESRICPVRPVPSRWTAAPCRRTTTVNDFEDNVSALRHRYPQPAASVNLSRVVSATKTLCSKISPRPRRIWQVPVRRRSCSKESKRKGKLRVAVVSALSTQQVSGDFALDGRVPSATHTSHTALARRRTLSFSSDTRGNICSAQLR